MPDVSTAPSEDLHKSAFPESDWTYFNAGPQHVMMMAKRSDAELRPVLTGESLIVVRYRVIVDAKLPWLRLRILHGGDLVEDVVVAQSEDRVLRLLSSAPHKPVRFEIAGVDGQPVDAAGRLRIPILQAIPVEKAVEPV